MNKYSDEDSVMQRNQDEIRIRNEISTLFGIYVLEQVTTNNNKKKTEKISHFPHLTGRMGIERKQKS